MEYNDTQVNAFSRAADDLWLTESTLKNPMWPIGELYSAGLLVYAVAALAGSGSPFSEGNRGLGRGLIVLCKPVAAAIEFCASAGALLTGAEFNWSLPSGLPFLHYGVRLDPLSAFFNLALSLLAACVAIYSVGYLKHGAARRRPGLFCCFFNLHLLSLTLVFTASNIIFFLIAWELMVVTSYFLVVIDHESVEVRKGGLLYILMSRGGTGMLYIGFLLLATAAGSMEFQALHGCGPRLSPRSARLRFCCCSSASA